MRPRRLLALAGACVCIPALATALEADDVAWGCEDAGYVLPETGDTQSGPGDAAGYTGLMLLVHTDMGVIPATYRLPEGQVYRDPAPRCADLDGDGEDEVIAVVSDAGQGARLAVYSKRRGPIAETPPVGQGTRWLVPAGTADFDGDGRTDIATVETPHDGRLRLWTLRDGALVELASAEGFSTHRTGQDAITGGVRYCGDGAELVLPSLDWSMLMRVRLAEGRLSAEPLAAATDPETVSAALACGDVNGEENG